MAINSMRGAVERNYGSSDEDSSVWDEIDNYVVKLKEQGVSLIVVIGDEEKDLRDLSDAQLNTKTMRELLLGFHSNNQIINARVRQIIERMHLNLDNSEEEL